jgi:hypothetical protein
LEPSKAARFETTSLESLSAAAGAEIVSSELFFELLVAVNDADASFHFGFRWETSASFTHRLEKTIRC